MFASAIAGCRRYNCSIVTPVPKKHGIFAPTRSFSNSFCELDRQCDYYKKDFFWFSCHDTEMSNSPLFDEWVLLTGKEGLDDLTSDTAADMKSPITSRDALIVIDVQRDFVPWSAQNKGGGRLGCPEGDVVVGPIVDLINHAANVGATIIASRDYHPHDHCSFACAGGPFPAHCVQGSSGSKFVPVVARALEAAMHTNGTDKTFVAFKAMHESIDSFGALPYAAAPHGEGRVVSAVQQLDKEAAAKFSEHGKCMGCDNAPWTGSLILKQSANADVTRENAELARPTDSVRKYNADAPPDVLAALNDGINRNLRTMQDVIKANVDAEQGRVFVCGLTLDLCVHDTCVNARAMGFERVALCIDAARAAHVAGVGSHGSGFLADPAEIHKSLISSGVSVVQLSEIIPPHARHMDSIAGSVGVKFPSELGGISLRPASGLRIELIKTVPLRSDSAKDAVRAAALAAEAAQQVVASPSHAHIAKGKFKDTTGHGAGRYSLALVGPLAPLAGGGGGAHAFRNTGIVSPRAPIPSDWPGVPEGCGATHLCWAYPMSDLSPARLGAEGGKIFMAISSSAELRFAAYGGFLLLDATGNVVMAQALGDTTDDDFNIAFEEPKPWREEFSAQLEVERRLQQVGCAALLLDCHERLSSHRCLEIAYLGNLATAQVSRSTQVLLVGSR